MTRYGDNGGAFALLSLQQAFKQTAKEIASLIRQRFKRQGWMD